MRLCIVTDEISQDLASLAGYGGLLSLETHYEVPNVGAEKTIRESLAVIRELCEGAGIRLQG